MPEPRWTHAELDRALRALARDVAYPEPPGLVPAVTTRLAAERVARARPAFPGTALWSRRRLLVVVAVAALALLAVAAAARFVIGTAEVRVQPGVSPTGRPPLEPGGLGEPIPVADVPTAVGFRVRFPAGPAPEVAYVFRGPSGTDGVLLAWPASGAYPPLPGTPWGLALMQIEGDEGVVLKTIGQAEDVEVVSVDGHRAFWLSEPHALDVQTADGDRAFSVEGSVLIWAAEGLTYRLETSLGLAEAIALAASIR